MTAVHRCSTDGRKLREKKVLERVCHTPTNTANDVHHNMKRGLPIYSQVGEKQREGNIFKNTELLLPDTEHTSNICHAAVKDIDTCINRRRSVSYSLTIVQQLIPTSLLTIYI